MYIKRIALQNIGPITELAVDLPFHENGFPKPIVFVGENGSGKTILQSQIIDSLYEIGGKLFDNIRVLDGQNYKYYKVSGPTNLQFGKKSGFSLLEFIDNEGNSIEYLDKSGNLDKADFTNLLPSFNLNPNDEKGSQKQITSLDGPLKERLKQEWLTGAHFYQPAYRYEEPFWKNNAFADQTRFKETKNITNQFNNDIEIVSSTQDNKNFLLDLVLDYEVLKNPIDQMNWANINNLLREIKKKKNIRFGIGPRGRYRVGIVEQNEDGSVKKQILPSIDNLSLGESILLNIFLNIIRYADQPPKFLNQIKGIVAIDEIDVHLHTDLQNGVLPRLIKLFPQVQFIITTHSPLFLLGMEKELGENNFEIRNMPSGKPITIDRFSEFESAYEVLKATEKFEKSIEEKVKKTEKQIMFVEGETDADYIKKAAVLLGKESILTNVEIIDGKGSAKLRAIWNTYNKTELYKVNSKKTLLLFDCDTEVKEKEFKNIYKRMIPFQKKSHIKIGIENLFPNSLINKAIKHKKDFIDITPQIKKIVRGKEVVALKKHEINEDEKRNLCDWICENASKEDFKQFSLIFDILESTIVN